MYKVQMDISNWVDDDSLTIETCDFNKVQIIQKFIEFQQENDWTANYDLVIVDNEEVEDSEEAEDEPATVSTYDATKTED
jgi:hypothetical protein